MLPDRYTQLLTAFVDGELNERQHQALLRLLQKSAEARALLSELEEDAGRLKALPAPTLGDDFSGEVLERLESMPAPGIRPKRVAGSIPTWVGAAVAAAILLAVTGVSYRFFSAGRQPQITQVEPAPPANKLPMIAGTIEATTERFADPALRVDMADLAQEKTQTRLTNELKKQNAVHLELACKNTAEAVSGLKDALNKSGVKVLEDASTKAQLKNGTTVMLVYAENLRPEELAEILGRLAAREKMKDLLDRQFASVHLGTLSAEYRDQVAGRFGMKGTQLPPPSRDLLAKFIEAPKGKSKKSGPAVSQSPAPDKFALVFAKEPAGQSTVSPELQRFLQAHRRQPAAPGTLQIVVVVRPERA